jgi:hypothetical protein
VEAWETIGVTAHPDKVEMGVENSEIQGYIVDSRRHTISVSVKKRWMLMQAMLRMLMQRCVTVKVLWRLVGKLGFVQSARVCLRSLIEVTYSFLQEVRDKKVKLVALPPVVWWELFTAMLSLPLASSEWMLLGAHVSR